MNTMARTRSFPFANLRTLIMRTCTFIFTAAAAMVLLMPAAQAQAPSQAATQAQEPLAARPSHAPDFQSDGNRFLTRGGENLYRAVCQACHMPQGEGAKGAGFYPALAQNPRFASGVYPMYIVLNGLHGMPAFGERLDDQQVADIVNFVRVSFGNTYTDRVSPEDVKKARP